MDEQFLEGTESYGSPGFAPGPARRDLAKLEPPQRLAILEAVLFSASGPMKTEELQDACGWPAALLEQDLAALADTYIGRGIELCRAGGAWRLMTSAWTAPWVERFLKVESRRRLSKAQLETLSIVAYRQPVTRAEIESYRGARSDRPLSQLEDLNLVKSVGRSQAPGHPIQYGTTLDFMRYFGLNSLEELPEVSLEAELFRRISEPVRNIAEIEDVSKPAALSDGQSGTASASDKKADPEITETPADFEAPSSDLVKLFAKIKKRGLSAFPQTGNN